MDIREIGEEVFFLDNLDDPADAIIAKPKLITSEHFEPGYKRPERGSRS